MSSQDNLGWKVKVKKGDKECSLKEGTPTLSLQEAGDKLKTVIFNETKEKESEE